MAVGGCTGAGTATQPAPVWTTTDTFCVAKSSATCSDGAHACVAKPASGSVCARVPTTAGCPAGYTGSSGTYYADYTPGSCGTCGGAACTKATGMTCSVSAYVSTASGCGGTPSSFNTLCTALSTGIGNYNSLSVTYTLSGTNNCSAQPTTNPAVAADPTQICCQ